MTVQDTRDLYPVLNKCTYLDTASSGLLSVRQQEWRATYDEQFVQGGSMFRESIIQDLDGVRGTISKAFGCSMTDIALISNFSYGMNAIAESLPQSSKVLVLGGDYPSVTLPLESRGFDMVTVPPYLLSEADIAQRIKDHQIDILAMSMTQWVSGLHLGVDFFKKLKIDFPDLLIIADGTQSLGTAPLDFRNSGIDILISSAYKWLGGGYGCGFMICNEKALDNMTIVSAGNATIMTRLFGDHDYPMQAFEPGHLDYLAMSTMRMGIETLLSVGLAEVERRISKVSLHAKAQLANMGYIHPSSLAGGMHRGIIHFLAGKQVVDFLREQQIVVSYRDGLRMSIHHYNTEADVNKMLAALRVFR